MLKLQKPNNKSGINMDNKTKILLLMSGSIAAYKTCYLISQLVQNNYDVQVVATPSTFQFIGASSLEGLTGHPVQSDLFAPHHSMDHIYLARWADLILLCPATANTINKMASGIGDDLVTNLYLAHDFSKPFLLAPAMNTAMYLHPATQDSLEKLQKLGLKILNTGDGTLACGEMGKGRLLEPDQIFQEIKIALQDKIPSNTPSINAADIKLKNNNSINQIRSPKILITSGGTQEPIDAMRVLTNLSTGQTGAFLAEALYDHGFEVTYLGANQAVKPHRPCTIHLFNTFNELNLQLKNLLAENQYLAVIHAAAVSDFHISKIHSANKEVELDSSNKLSSQDKIFLELSPNFKLLPLLKKYSQKYQDPLAHPSTLDAQKSDPIIIGFKYTSTSEDVKRTEAVKKLFNEGGVDWIVHNDHHDIHRDKGVHPFTLFSVNPNLTPSLFLPNKLALVEELASIFNLKLNSKEITP